MTERRELEGIGYHYFDTNDDCLLVNQWIKRPDDLTGQSVPISKLLPRGARCGGMNRNNWGNGGAPRGNRPSVTFKFRIVVEIEMMKNGK
jgi:hypothetical protein